DSSAPQMRVGAGGPGLRPHPRPRCEFVPAAPGSGRIRAQDASLFRRPRAPAASAPEMQARFGGFGLESRTMDVKAELAGNLWKIVVRERQAVAADETLMILESMKMEIPITAPRAGTVTKIMVREGETVQEGQVLAQLD